MHAVPLSKHDTTAQGMHAYACCVAHAMLLHAVLLSTHDRTHAMLSHGVPPSTHDCVHACSASACGTA